MSDMNLPTVTVLKWVGADHHTIRWDEGQGVPGTYALVPVDQMEKVWWCGTYRTAVLDWAEPVEGVCAACEFRVDERGCGWRWLVSTKGAEG